MKKFRKALFICLTAACLICVTLVSMTFFASRNARHSTDLIEARTGFSTMLIPNRIKTDGPPDQPPAKVFQLIHYAASPGQLAAYLTPPPKNAQVKRPALIWLKGGWGGIGSFLWEPDSGQSPIAFCEAGFVVMCPSFRGENDNPGKIEAFYGEVNDILAAYDYVEKLPYVDRKRIYIAGHSTGGTLALLTAMATNKPRAVFSFGGKLDTKAYFRMKGLLGAMPFNWLNNTEIRLRNPGEFIASVKAPLYHFEGEEYAEPGEFAMAQQRAEQLHKPYTGYIVKRADHFNYLPLATYWLADALMKDNLKKNLPPVQPDVLQDVFDKMMNSPANTGKGKR